MNGISLELVELVFNYFYHDLVWVRILSDLSSEHICEKVFNDKMKGIDLKLSKTKGQQIKQIHLTGAATNPWIGIESDDSFIKFEIRTN